MAIIFPDNHNEKQQFNLGENLNLVFSFNKYKISRGLHYISVVIVNSSGVDDRLVELKRITSYEK